MPICKSFLKYSLQWGQSILSQKWLTMFLVYLAGVNFVEKVWDFLNSKNAECEMSGWKVFLALTSFWQFYSHPLGRFIGGLGQGQLHTQQRYNPLTLNQTRVALLYFDISLQVKCDFWTQFFCAVLVAQGIRATGFKRATVNFALHFK